VDREKVDGKERGFGVQGCEGLVDTVFTKTSEVSRTTVSEEAVSQPGLTKGASHPATGARNALGRVARRRTRRRTAEEGAGAGGTDWGAGTGGGGALCRACCEVCLDQPALRTRG
jgi:hypothetical protein